MWKYAGRKHHIYKVNNYTFYILCKKYWCGHFSHHFRHVHTVHLCLCEQDKKKTTQKWFTLLPPALQRTTWVSSAESVCSLFQLQVLVNHTTPWSETDSSPPGREPITTVSQRLSACALKRLAVTATLNPSAMDDDGSLVWKIGGHPMCS